MPRPRRTSTTTRRSTYDYAIATAIKFQLHDHIAREILKQDPRECNYYGDKRVGDFLRNILALGATRDWNAVLREATGEGLSARAMAPISRRWPSGSSGRTGGGPSGGADRVHRRAGRPAPPAGMRRGVPEVRRGISRRADSALRACGPARPGSYRAPPSWSQSTARPRVSPRPGPGCASGCRSPRRAASRARSPRGRCGATA